MLLKPQFSRFGKISLTKVLTSILNEKISYMKRYKDFLEARTSFCHLFNPLGRSHILGLLEEPLIKDSSLSTL